MTQHDDFQSIPNEVIQNEMIPKMSLKSLMNLRATDHRMRDLVNGYFLQHQKSEWKSEEQIYSMFRWKKDLWINSPPQQDLCVCDLERWFPCSSVVEFNDDWNQYSYFGYSNSEKSWIILETNPHHVYRKIKILDLSKYIVSFLIGMESSNWCHLDLFYYVDGYLLGSYNFRDDSDPEDIDSHLSEEFEAQVEMVANWLEKMMTRESYIKVVQ